MSSFISAVVLSGGAGALTLAYLSCSRRPEATALLPTSPVEHAKIALTALKETIKKEIPLVKKEEHLLADHVTTWLEELRGIFVRAVRDIRLRFYFPKTRITVAAITATIALYTYSSLRKFLKLQRTTRSHTPWTLLTHYLVHQKRRLERVVSRNEPETLLLMVTFLAVIIHVNREDVMMAFPELQHMPKAIIVY